MQIRVVTFTLSDEESNQALPVMIQAIAGSSDSSTGALPSSAEGDPFKWPLEETDGEPFSWPAPQIEPAREEPAESDNPIAPPVLSAKARTVTAHFPQPSRARRWGMAVSRWVFGENSYWSLPVALFWGFAVGSLLLAVAIVGVKLHRARQPAEPKPVVVEPVEEATVDCSAPAAGAIAPECENLPPGDASEKSGIHTDPPPTRRKGALESD